MKLQFVLTITDGKKIRIALKGKVVDSQSFDIGDINGKLNECQEYLTKILGTKIFIESSIVEAK